VHDIIVALCSVGSSHPHVVANNLLTYFDMEETKALQEVAGSGSEAGSDVDRTLAVAEPAEQATYECPKCLRDVASDKMIFKRTSEGGNKDSRICKDCKNACDRINRLNSLKDDMGNIENLSHKDRADMLVQAHSMSGLVLAKTVQDTIEKHQQTTRTRHFKQEDEFLDEIQVAEKFKHSEERCNAILAIPESGRLWCKGSKVWLYPVPSYTAEDRHEEKRVEKRGREISSEEQQKKPKAIKAIKEQSQADPDEAAKPIPPTKLAQLAKSLQKVDETKLSLDGLLSQCGASDMEKHVPAAAFVKAKEAIQGLITVKATLERLIDAKSASKEDNTQMKLVAQLISNAKVCVKKFQGYRADAASESD
jgi:hypothetical protein